MKSQLRHLVAEALHSVKSYNLPAACERYGLDSGVESEAFSSKRQYVMRRLEKLSDDKVFAVARDVVKDYPDDKLQAAIELLRQDGSLVSDITRTHLTEALNEFSLAGRRDLIEMLRTHWPSIDYASYHMLEGSVADDIHSHAVVKSDWGNAEILELAGFMTCSQARLFQFLEDVVQPIRRDQEEQERIVARLNPILRRDGFCLSPATRISGYPAYCICETTATGIGPADGIISQTLVSFDASGVHDAWRKALERRATDPDGAITAAKTLLETVCKHIIEAAGKSFGEKDDLPKLYSLVADCLKLAPSQHSEEVFRSILGNCQSVVGNLAGLRNKLGDSHGQGKRHVKPQARHAELAVNLAGSMAMFLISTWTARGH